MSKAAEFFTREVAEECAKEILRAFDEKGNTESIEVDFNLSRGKMVEPLDQVNTWFKFDCRDSGGTLQKVFEFLTELWRNEDTSEEDAATVRRFEAEVTECLREQVDVQSLGDTLRRCVFKSVPAALLPIEQIRFHRTEFAGGDEQGYILKVEKFARVDQESGQFLDQQAPVAKELIEIHTETGKSFKEIIKEKRAEGDPRYELVADAKLERYVKDVTVMLSGDYSFCENPIQERTS